MTITLTGRKFSTTRRLVSAADPSKFEEAAGLFDEACIFWVLTISLLFTVVEVGRRCSRPLSKARPQRIPVDQPFNN
jgi:hypothetical protein